MVQVCAAKAQGRESETEEVIFYATVVISRFFVDFRGLDVGGW
jgi:hypothetical protein